ncbi:MAG TPA: response regulator [Tepidisphaeraceae bacterium]|jgi:FixJ family two-component response regulator|nr:response regulator [Tepidisphaeraceae bacterium]
MAAVSSKTLTKFRPRMLVVDDEPAMLDLFRDLVAKAVNCQPVFASTLSDARAVMAQQAIDLLVADVNLPDGNGTLLLEELNRRHPLAAAVMMSGEPSVDCTISAMRGGAMDFLAKPFSPDQMAERIRKALIAHRLKRVQEMRFKKLKDTCKKLNEARKTISKKVDLLCNDLITAYGELSRSLETVRLQEGYSQFIAKANGLEQLLCHTMDWLLRQVGYCNIGIWLASAEHDLQLGAFMKYTIAAEPPLMEALQKNLLKLTMRRGFVRLGAADLKATLTPGELKYLAEQEILAINCTYLGESLAVMALFRDHNMPFSTDDVAAIKTMSPLFALSLARAVRGGDAEHDEPHEGNPPPSNENKPKKKDPADWWKNGEAPPF